ncbi:MAG: flagellar basal body L-ring protein FlgH [Pseudobacteriovorax sp.]|nr:flagellar basal body L-ring protein FlgH [Pseudobacteriovorax sp.]
MKRSTIILIALFVSACQTGLVPVSKRDYRRGLQPKQVSKNMRDIRDIAEVKKPNIFIRKKRSIIRRSTSQNNNGSLMSLDNPQNYLFVDRPIGNVGDIITVAVRSNAAKEDENDNGGEREAEELKDELLQALEKLEPSDQQLVPVTSIKFRVDRVMPNGDALVSYYRTSSNDVESNAVRVYARIARKTLLDKPGITTKDLLDIDWYERKDQEVFERNSINWEDEYTLRLSGFDEAKSRFAKSLDEKEGDIQEISNKLRERINALGQERRKIAETRQDLEKQKQNAEKIVSDLRSQAEKDKETIEDQKSIIKKQQGFIDELQGTDSEIQQAEASE